MKYLDRLPSFETPIVVYCGSGWRCTIALPALGALGWRDVVVLKEDSYRGWVAAGYPTVAGLPPEAAALNAASPDPTMVARLDRTFSNIPEGWGAITVDQFATELAENPDLVVLDVRTAAEQAENGVVDSDNLIHIPLEEMIRRKAEWPSDKDAPIVIHAGTDHRSTIAMSILWSYGYTDVRSLKGGLRAWTAAGYPVLEAVAP
jgi:rhodanese-related sulfurtransferase